MNKKTFENRGQQKKRSKAWWPKCWWKGTVKEKREKRKSYCDNLDEKQIEHLKIEDNKRKKGKRDNLNADEKKKQLGNCEKKGKKSICDNLNNEEKEHIKVEDSKRKKTKHDNLDNNEK